MTLQEAIAQGPAWIGIWLNIMLVGIFVLPVVLLFWRASRIAGIATLIASVVGVIAVGWMYDQLGWVRLLGLPHVILYTPVAIYLWQRLRDPDLPVWPWRVMLLVFATILITLAFDYVDVIRYLLGDSAPLYPVG